MSRDVLRKNYKLLQQDQLAMEDPVALGLEVFLNGRNDFVSCEFELENFLSFLNFFFLVMKIWNRTSWEALPPNNQSPAEYLSHPITIVAVSYVYGFSCNDWVGELIFILIN
jgi:hypothetical protein